MSAGALTFPRQSTGVLETWRRRSVQAREPGTTTWKNVGTRPNSPGRMATVMGGRHSHVSKDAGCIVHSTFRGRRTDASESDGPSQRPSRGERGGNGSGGTSADRAGTTRGSPWRSPRRTFVMMADLGHNHGTLVRHWTRAQCIHGSNAHVVGTRRHSRYHERRRRAPRVERSDVREARSRTGFEDV